MTKRTQNRQACLVQREMERGFTVREYSASLGWPDYADQSKRDRHEEAADGNCNRIRPIQMPFGRVARGTAPVQLPVSVFRTDACEVKPLVLDGDSRSCGSLPDCQPSARLLENLKARNYGHRAATR
jgi:hypothetical protein